VEDAKVITSNFYPDVIFMSDGSVTGLLSFCFNKLFEKYL